MRSVSCSAFLINPGVIRLQATQSREAFRHTVLKTTGERESDGLLQLCWVQGCGADRIHARYRPAWQCLRRSERLADDRPLDLGGVAITNVGMGRVGTGAYDDVVQMRRGRSSEWTSIRPSFDATS